MLKEYLSNLANRFRTILGTTEPINAQDFEGAIGDVFAKGHYVGESIGYDRGFADGKAEGGNTEEAYNQGVADGKQAEYDAFWDNYQEYGNRTDYMGGFSGPSWNSELFKPKHLPMKITDGEGMFYGFDRSEKKTPLIVDETIVDFTNAKTLANIFRDANISAVIMNTIPTKAKSTSGMCRQTNVGYHVITTLKLGVHEEMTFDSYTFYIGSLENLSFVDGSVIGTNISFQVSRSLTLESMRNIISVLKDYSVTSTTRILTLHADAKAKLTETDIANITQKGWTLA